MFYKNTGQNMNWKIVNLLWKDKDIFERLTAPTNQRNIQRPNKVYNNTQNNKNQ